jgi:hypothetical protein
MSPETDDEIAPFQGLAGEIVEVTGRLAEGGHSGLPAIERITLRLDADGTELEFSLPSSGPHSPLDLVAPIFAQSFARVDRSRGTWSPVCPICLTEGPLSDDHVPQGPLSGSEMTMTCEPCNNLLGSRVESELQDWFDHVLVGPRFAHQDVPGPRRSPRVLYREGPNGLGLLLDDPGPVIMEMIRTGTFWLHFRPPDPRRFKLAALKHAYLAVCLYLGYVPGIRDAVEIRADLLAARDTPRHVPPPVSGHADRLSLYRSDLAPQGPPLAIVATCPENPDEEPEYLISLAGTLFVSWPFSIVPPMRHFQIVPMFD